MLWNHRHLGSGMKMEISRGFRNAAAGNRLELSVGQGRGIRDGGWCITGSKPKERAGQRSRVRRRANCAKSEGGGKGASQMEVKISGGQTMRGEGSATIAGAKNRGQEPKILVMRQHKKDTSQEGDCLKSQNQWEKKGVEGLKTNHPVNRKKWAAAKRRWSENCKP